MFQENIEFIKKSIESGNPEYGIISLTVDTLDAMRSLVAEERFEEVDRYQFVASMGKILEGMYGLDAIIEKINQEID